MRGMVFLMAVLIGISGWYEIADKETAQKVTNQRRVTGEGMETETEAFIPESLEMATESPEPEDMEATARICVTNIWPAYENGYKIYDGTAYVALEADVTGLLEGMHLELWGVTEQADAGTWKVEVQMQLQTENMEEETEYEIIMDEPELTITVLPKPLTITVSDVIRNYYEEPELSEVEVLSEKGPVQVTGFVNDAIPEGFVLPELMWNREVIQKDSPMYRDGERIEYKEAIVVKTDEEGRPTGNATQNYCFVLDKNSGYYEPGSVFLREPVLLGTLDYRIHAIPEEGVYRDEAGIIWVRSGTVLQMHPEEGNGFNSGTATEGLTASGTAALQLLRKNKNGDVTASSYPQYISYQVDDKPPQADIGVEGIGSQPGETIYRKNQVVCGVLEMKDTGSGIRSVQICAVSGQFEKEYSPEEFYYSYPQNWQPGIQTTLSEEGMYTVMVRLEDYVGNVCYVKSGPIVIDRTAPELEIQGVLPGSANNDTVAPLVFCQDEYYQVGSLAVRLTGNEVGEKAFAQERTLHTYGEEIKIQDIPREKQWDDLYVLCASACDLAGNMAEKKVVFSINRFGSVYRLDPQTQKSLEQYYLKEPVEMAVWEFNVDTVQQEKIWIGYGTQIKKLERGMQYRVSRQQGTKGWREYCYRIAANNFLEEGAYYVVLATVDRAENMTDNQMQKIKIEFAIDRTAPDVFVSGVENDGQYGEEKRVAVVTCQDNQKLETVQIYLNGELIAENNREQQKVEIAASEKWQKLEVRAVDGAGNTTILNPVTFYIGEKKVSEKRAVEKKILEKTTEEKSPIQEKETEEKAVLKENKKAFLASSQGEKIAVQIVVFLVITGVIGGYLYKIKKAKE